MHRRGRPHAASPAGPRGRPAGGARDPRLDDPRVDSLRRPGVRSGWVFDVSWGSIMGARRADRGRRTRNRPAGSRILRCCVTAAAVAAGALVWVTPYAVAQEPVPSQTAAPPPAPAEAASGVPIPQPDPAPAPKRPAPVAGATRPAPSPSIPARVPRSTAPPAAAPAPPRAVAPTRAAGVARRPSQAGPAARAAQLASPPSAPARAPADEHRAGADRPRRGTTARRPARHGSRRRAAPRHGAPGSGSERPERRSAPPATTAHVGGPSSARSAPAVAADRDRSRRLALAGGALLALALANLGLLGVARAGGRLRAGS
jgi:hypothetical protein